MRDALVGFNREQMASGLPEIRVGFGVATGEVVAGNVGSDRKIEYTVIGDAVNLAARLQELTRELGQPILISAEAARAARSTSPSVELRPIGTQQIRGRHEPVEVFVPVAPDPGVAPSPA
jgi:adenylate cyclase